MSWFDNGELHELRYKKRGERNPKAELLNT